MGVYCRHNLERKKKKMSHDGNTQFLEFWFNHFLEEGFTEAEAEKLAEEKFDETPTLWG